MRNQPEHSIRHVSAETTDVYDAVEATRIHDLCRAFDDATEPLDAERTTSRMHGRMWELRRRATTRQQPNWSYGLGAPFARQLARTGGPGAKGLLYSLGLQAPPRLQQLCFGLAFDLPVRMPAWANELPRAELTRAAVTSPDESVQLVMLEFHRGAHQPFTIATMITAERGGIVRHYALIGAMETFADGGDPHGDFTFDGQALTELAPGEACRRVRASIDRTETVNPRHYDLDSAKDLRALTLCRIEPYLPELGGEPETSPRRSSDR